MANVGAQIFIGIAFNLLARELLADEPDTPLQDEKPSTTARRGEELPQFVGRERLGAKVGWVGDRWSINEDQPGQGGKGTSQGGGGAQNKVWFERGWHQLAVGPCWALYKIWQDGEVIWDNGPGGITALSHPSGTTIDIDSDNSFRIYWGETDQPIDALLPGRVGVESRWPFCCHIVWVKKRLGGFPNWQALEYDLECRPYSPAQLYNGGASYDYDALGTELGGSDAWLENGPDEASSPSYLIAEMANGNPTTIKICDPSPVGIDRTADFQPGQLIRIVDSDALNDGDYLVTNSSFNAGETLFSVATESPRDIRAQADQWLAGGSGTGNSNDIGLASVQNSQAPPGVLLTGAGNGTWRDFFTMQAGVLDAADAFARRSLNTGAYVPPGAGSSDELGTDVVEVSFYVDTQPLVFSASWQVRLVNALAGADPAAAHGVQINVDPTAGVTFDFAIGGGIFGANITNLDSRWYLVQFRYRAGLGGTPITATDTVWLDVSPASTGDVPVIGEVLTLVMSGDGSGNAIPVIQSFGTTDCTGVTTIEFDFDFANPVDSMGEIISLQPGPFGEQGANGAHMLNQLMTQSFPHGAGLDVNCLNLASLIQMGVDLDAGTGEGLRSHFFSGKGQPYSGIIGNILVDLGATWGWDITVDPGTDGPLVFTLVREAFTQLTLTEAHILPKPPQVDRVLEASALDSISYEFRNRETNYKDDAIVVDDDGKGRQEERQTRRSEKLFTVRDSVAAQQVAERRAQEDISPFSNYTVQAHRDANRLRPGDPIVLPAATGLDLPLRVLSMKDSANNQHTTIKAAVDVYSVAAAAEFSTTGGTGTGPTSGTLLPGQPPLAARVFADHQQRLFEVGAFLSEELSLLHLRTRSDQCQGAAQIIASDDGTTYSALSYGAQSLAGGTLISDFASDYQEIDPDGLGLDTVCRQGKVEYGPAFLSPTDDPLSLPAQDDPNWYAGRLIAIVNAEIFFVRELEALGNNAYRLRGLHRGRFETKAGSHVIGDELYLIPVGQFRPRIDVLPAKGAQTFFKYLVDCNGQFGTAAAAPQLDITPTGKALRPLDPTNLRRQDTLSPSFMAGEDVPVRWSWRHPDGYRNRTGLGFQQFGEIIEQGESLQGTFTLAILDATGTTTVRTVEGLTSPEYVYTQVDRIADFGVEQTFRVDVVHLGPAAEASVRATQNFELI